MIRRWIQQAFPLVARVGADPDDSDEVRVQKSSLVVGSCMFIVAGSLWGILYFIFGRVIAGVIPFSYAVVSFISILIFHFTRRYRFFIFSQLLLILIMPFLLMISLGGFVNSSGVILWSLICPLVALIFLKPTQALGWLVAYLVLVAFSGFLEFHPIVNLPLSPTLRDIFFVLNIGAVSTIAVVLLAYFVSQRNVLFNLLQDEQSKSESLLLNILPKEIAGILKDENRLIADEFPDASVMFADMVGFTPLSTQIPPVEMVELLNEIYSFFDSLLDKYGVEKIRTIGDNYMVAAGVPVRRPDHAKALVSMALEMRDYIADHTFNHGRRVTFRIGINSGSMIGGVIGQRKFVYDVWGDTVNVASRMESNGLGGTVQISYSTYTLIKDDFVCEPRGRLNIKGKGEMEVWLVKSAR